MELTRSFKHYLGLIGKGVLMGAADAVPGVSGGTIAFMTGIYEELLHSIKLCGPEALITLFKQGPKAGWRHINGNFLACVFGGILLSLLTLSHLVLFWLDHYPQLLWSFFFGLILASVYFVGKRVPHWNLATTAMFITGTLLAYGITSITPVETVATPLTVFLAGMLAICAMILPGISGSFILLLLGLYSSIMLAVKEFQIVTLILFAAGAVIGLLSFSRLLDWMFQRYKATTLALLTGFMLGSLNKVWPWKVTLETMLNRHGETIPVVQENVLPNTFSQVNNVPAYLSLALVLMLVGVVLVWIMEKLAPAESDSF